MYIDTEKLKQVIESLYDEVGGFCISSEACIFEGEDSNGKPMQIIIKATIDEDELVEEGDAEACIYPHKPD